MSSFSGLSTSRIMYCPYCHAADTKVIDSRWVNEGNQVRRRRECIECSERFTTFETAELVLPRVIKRDGSRTVFDLQKIRNGMLKSLEKRSVTIDQIEAAICRIMKTVRSNGEREISSRMIGEIVMQELRTLDPVAYVRFASVYRSFQDVNAFHEEIERL